MSIRIVVAHGFNAHPGKNWFPWLVSQYRPGVVAVPALPDPTAAQLDAWVATLSDALGTVDDDTIIVGHSLGGITAIRTLERLPRPWSLRGLVLVSGFAEAVPGVAKLDHFTAEPVDAGLIVHSVRHRRLLASDNDTEIVPAMTARLAQLLDAPLLTVPGAAHFSEKTGVVSVPELLPILDGMLGDDLGAVVAPERAGG
jgi:predicted alpha/beta hydrolase family esterase